MSRAYIEVRINIARRELEYWQNLLRNKSCDDCKEFQQGVCNKAGGVRPPPDIIKTGCPEWDWDEIPF
jgi:predicted metal-binding protein